MNTFELPFSILEPVTGSNNIIGEFQVCSVIAHWKDCNHQSKTYAQENVISTVVTLALQGVSLLADREARAGVPQPRMGGA